MDNGVIVTQKRKIKMDDYELKIIIKVLEVYSSFAPRC